MHSSLVDPSIFRVALWADLLPTVHIKVKRVSADSGNSFVCRLAKGDMNPCGEQFPSQKAMRPHQLWSFFSGRSQVGRRSIGGCAVERVPVVSIPVLLC